MRAAIVILALMAALGLVASPADPVLAQAGAGAQSKAKAKAKARPKAGPERVAPAPPPGMAGFRQCVAATDHDEDSGVRCEQYIYVPCQRAHPQPETTLAITECTVSVSAGWDIVLNERWTIATRNASPAALSRLRAAQRLWIQGREADCAAVYEEFIAGTIRTVMAASCQARSTRQRYYFLRTLSME